jgi:hypothetical protein
MNRLLEIGFQPVGHWLLEERGPTLHLRALTESKNILYAFVTYGEVKYIGKTTQPLKARMLGYQRPAATQATNIRNNKYIHDILRQGKTVDIFGLPDNGLLHYGKFHVNLAAGLEDSLISALRPEWNGQRTARPVLVESEATVATGEILSDDVQNIPLEHTPMENDPASAEHGITMPLILQVTYFNQGFFNVPVEYQRYFGNDLEKIDIYCGEEQSFVAGYINRTANSNATPRIMGGIQLKRWMHKASHAMGAIDVVIQSPTSIKLTPHRLDTGGGAAVTKLSMNTEQGKV